MKISLKTRLYAGFVIAIVLVVAGALLSYRTYKQQVSEAGWVQHTYEVITQTQRLNRYTYEMLTAGASYRITHDRKTLDPFFAARPKVGPAMQELKKMLADNPPQMLRADSLEEHMNGLLRYWDSLGTTIPLDYVFSNPKEISARESLLLNRVLGNLLTIINSERELLAARQEESREAGAQYARVLLINTLLILVVAFTLMYVTFREAAKRLRAQQQLRNKLKEVVALNEAANEKNWLLTGLSAVNDSLQGNYELEPLAAKVLQTLVRYLQWPAGALYTFQEDTRRLRLMAGVALPANIQQEYNAGEGLPGQAATEKGMVLLKDVPPGFWHISGGTGETKPAVVVYLPLWHDSEPVGVIELASFKNVAPQEQELLHTIANDIAVAINAANGRSKVLMLLKQVQEQKETLIAQQEELRQSNEELTRQSEVLQASEEELRVQEEELRQVNDEMSEKNKALELARQELSQKAEELEQSSRYKSEFLANMSHELRTPLNSVLILARLLEENSQRNLTPKQIEYAGIIHKSGSDLLKLINDILDLSKIEAGRVEMVFEETPVKDMVRDLQQLFRVVADEKGIAFMLEVQEDVPERVRTDRQRLEQVLKNLLSNAFKFTPMGGTVKMQWSLQPNNYLHISVADTGIGIPAGKQEQVFDAFRQADGSTSRKFGGTGLGLSISRELVRRLGGAIRLESYEGQGSTFTVMLPLDEALQPTIAPAPLPEELEAAAERPALAIPARPSGTGEELEDDREQLGQHKPVLIIEDDASFASILRDFARSKGYRTIVALNGNDGLYYARKYLPAAIILDMNLPLIDGTSILKILKSTEELKHILVHVISAGEISTMVRDKVNGYKQKPLQAADLEAVFGDISRQLRAGFKKVLVISDGGLLHHPSLQHLSDERQLQTQYELVKDIPAALRQLQQQQYDGIVLDAGDDVKAGIAQLQALRGQEASRSTPVIVYLDQDISATDEQQLKKEAAAIVRNSTFSANRLMDELELFLYKVKEAETDPSQTVKAQLSEKRLEGRKVLLADDDMRNVFSLSALLAEQGLDVITAGDGREALQMLEEHPDVSLVLMDIMMPEMDGYEAMQHIRANSRFAQLPIIALTAKAMAGDREKCIAAGASDYISKPVDSGRLLSMIRVWLS